MSAIAAVQFIGFLVVFLLTSAIFLVLVKAQRFRPRIKIAEGFAPVRPSSSNHKYYGEVLSRHADVRKRWKEIAAWAASNKERDWRLAIIEADNLVDGMLKRCGAAGKDMAERLRAIHANVFSDAQLNRLWSSHKIRNRIAHEVGFKLYPSEVEQSIEIYELALEKLMARELELI